VLGGKRGSFAGGNISFSGSVYYRWGGGSREGGGFIFTKKNNLFLLANSRGGEVENEEEGKGLCRGGERHFLSQERAPVGGRSFLRGGGNSGRKERGGKRESSKKCKGGRRGESLLPEGKSTLLCRASS